MSITVHYQKVRTVGMEARALLSDAAAVWLAVGLARTVIIHHILPYILLLFIHRI